MSCTTINHHTKAALTIFLSIAVLFMMGSCATRYPERYSSDECLVVVSTTLDNPKGLPVGRKYSFRLADGTIISVAGREFVAFKVYGPGMTIEHISSHVEAEFQGDSSRDMVDIPLPYIPGEVVVADFEFIHKLSKKDEQTILSETSFRKLPPDGIERLLEKLRSADGYSTWFAEPSTLSRMGYDPTADRPAFRLLKKPGY